VVSRYHHDSSWNREERVEDLQRMVTLFTGEFGYEHVPVMGLDPTWMQIQDAVRDFCTSPQRRPEDYVTVYLAGQGEMLEVGDRFEYVLLPADSNPADLRRRAVRGGDLAEWMLADTLVRRILLILDTCYSGQGGLDFARDAMARIGERGRLSEQRVAGVVVVTATQPAQQAIPGAFTAAFARAVRAQAMSGYAPRTLDLTAVLSAMNADPKLPASQKAQCSVLPLSGAIPDFLPNPHLLPYPHLDISVADLQKNPSIPPASLPLPEGLAGPSPSIAAPRGPSGGFNGQQARLFISYSHRDERYLKTLKVHLASLRRQGLIADWHDRLITPGEEWRQAIDDSLDSADCVLLLVTPDFIASDYCYSVEMERALQKHRAGQILVLPIIVRPADWQHTPLSELQAVPKDGKPIVEWAVRDRAWLDVTAGLRLALGRFTQKA
jgi:hypothetical protein